MVVSDQSGKSNILSRFAELNIDLDPGDSRVSRLVETVKQRDYDGYAYDSAAASFEMLARRMLGQVPNYFRVERFTVVDERRFNARGEVVQESQALHEVSFGTGPVNALDSALRKALEPTYPVLKKMRLADYRVRILRAGHASAAMPRVLIESANGKGETWSTVGVSTNVIDASFDALLDSFTYKLFRNGVTAG